jgi:signal transduction histidine kinase
MRQRLLAVFAVIAAALVALDLVFLVALLPQLRRSEALSTRYAANSRLIARLHGALHAMRTGAVQEHMRLRAGSPGGSDAADARAARRAFEAAAAEYVAIPLNAEESAVWQVLEREALPAFVRAVEFVLQPAGAADPPDQEALREVRETSARVDELLQRLVEVNAHELTEVGRRIHSTIQTLVVLCLALGVAGLVAGGLLVRWALRAVGDYERGMQERLQELDDFAGRVAHDLRNPLQTMSVALWAIRRRAADAATISTCSKAQEGAARMGAFIQELLTFARSGARPDPGAVARVQEILREVRQDLSAQAEQKGVELRVDPGPDVHAAIGPEALRAIVANLADNAVKHMPPEQPDRCVELCVSEGAAGVVIRVRDTGAGIAPEAIPRVFDPFYRATGRPGGFGLGLKTVKRLVDAHRGRIEVESALGRGSTFTVTLPAAPRPPDAEGPRRPARYEGGVPA